WYAIVASLARPSFASTGMSTAGSSSLSRHDALPISVIVALAAAAGGWFSKGDVGLVLGLIGGAALGRVVAVLCFKKRRTATTRPDRKSTGLNSSHDQISYAVFCLKKKTKTMDEITNQ